MTNQQTTQTNAFDIHTYAAGYANRIRLVVPAKGNSYYALEVSSPRGMPDSQTGKYKYTTYDCYNVVGSLAKRRIEELLTLQDEGKKIFVSCKFCDEYPDSFTLKNGPNAGKQKHVIKCKLLKIHSAKVDGENYEFKAQPEENNSQSNDNDTNQQANQDCNSQPNSDAADQNTDQQQSNQEVDAMGRPLVLELNPTDSDYPEQIVEVTGWGYKRDPQDGLWKLPEAA